jgi:hypothetical protein
MDKIDENTNQFLTDLQTMKTQLIRVKGAATSVESLKSSDMEDIELEMDTLVARLQMSYLGGSHRPTLSP